MRNLLAFLVKYYHWFVFVCLEIIGMTLLFQYNSYHASVWFSSANAVAGKVYEWDAAVRSYLSMGQVNRQLTTRIFYLERQTQQLREAYERLTGDTTLQEREGWNFIRQYQLIPSKVISNSVSQPNNLMTIDKGRLDGVKNNMGVVCGTGIVGVVYMVSDHYSVVIPALNRHSQISCSIRNRGYFGYLKWTGGDASIAYVEDIPRHAYFKRGEWVETNGYSSIFPKGVLVGKIVEVYNSKDGLSYRLKVQLSTDFAHLSEVCVINDSTIAERLNLLQSAKDSLTIH